MHRGRYWSSQSSRWESKNLILDVRQPSKPFCTARGRMLVLLTGCCRRLVNNFVAADCECLHLSVARRPEHCARTSLGSHVPIELIRCSRCFVIRDLRVRANFTHKPLPPLSCTHHCKATPAITHQPLHKFPDNCRSVLDHPGQHHPSHPTTCPTSKTKPSIIWTRLIRR